MSGSGERASISEECLLAGMGDGIRNGELREEREVGWELSDEGVEDGVLRRMSWK